MIIIRILQIIIGLGLLFLGRRLFWFFVAAIGFITATEIAVNTMSTSPEWVIILIGLAAGLLGALLAIFSRLARSAWQVSWVEVISRC